MLFSEPKIPQFDNDYEIITFAGGFSALQRAENSSMFARRPLLAPRRTFQCSSASRKFLNSTVICNFFASPTGFSALQRAENSSIFSEHVRFLKRQCFSALQRAENSSILLRLRNRLAIARFSALQRAENSSILTYRRRRRC